MKGYVEPIRNLEDIERVKTYLKEKDIRYYTIFMIGIYSGLRVSDICSLDISDVKDKTYVELKEQKTGKYKRFPLNQNLQDVIKEYLLYRDEQYGMAENLNALFVGKKHCRLDRSIVYRVLVKACKDLNIDANIGTHTMRKTFGYHFFRQHPEQIVILQQLFNHSSLDITKRYIGVQQEELDAAYLGLDYDKSVEDLKERRNGYRRKSHANYDDISNGLDYLFNLYKKIDTRISKIENNNSGVIKFLQNYIKSGKLEHRAFAEAALSYRKEF